MVAYTRSDWLIPAGLIALAAIPVIAGTVRIGLLVSGAPVTPDNVRFVAAPLPVVLHIVAATVYCVVGAFQFSPGLRRNHRRWHRLSGRALVGLGLVAALSGIWMAMTYEIVPADTLALHVLRLLAGGGMAAALVLGFSAIRSGDVESHQAWMRRGYAIGIGAGTQALTMMVPAIIFGNIGDTMRTAMMGLGWLINLAVAEWLIRRRRRKTQRSLAGRLGRSAFNLGDERADNSV